MHRPHWFLACALLALLLVGCPKKKDRAYVPDLRGNGEFTLADVKGAGWDTRTVILGDVDGDGDLDAFVANFGEQNRLLINDGSGTFTDGTDNGGAATTGLPLAQNSSQTAAFGDVDGDGDLDIVVGNTGQNTLLINDGNGQFTDGTDSARLLPTGLPNGLDDTRAIALVNVDGEGGFDSDLDLVVVNNGQNRLYLNDGQGEFLDGTDLAGIYTTGLPLDADPGQGLLVVNIDGDVAGNTSPDLVILNDGAPNRLLVNTTGFGEFVDATVNTLDRAATLPYLSEKSRDAAALDINNDTLVDLVIATHGKNRILINQGAGLFTDGRSDWIRERVLVDGSLSGLSGSAVPASVWAVGGNGTVRQSPGAGNWNVVASNLVTSNLNAVWAQAGSNVAFAVGDGGTVLTNVSGPWAVLSQSATTKNLHAASGITASQVYFAGEGGVILHHDGTTTTLEREHTSAPLTAAFGATGSAVFLGGRNGTILRGTSAAFASTTSGTTTEIRGFWGTADTDMYAVGGSGTILHYWDQGGSASLGWYGETSGTIYGLNAISGRTGESWAVGDYDVQAGEFTILKETGSGWTAVQPGLGFGENLNAVWVDPATGDVFAVGDLGVAIRYDVSGATWADDTSVLNTPNRIRAIHGQAEDNVIAVGDSGLLFHWDGSSWDRFDSPTGLNLTGVWMEDASHALITGFSGEIYRFDIGTGTWTAQTSPTAKDLYAVWGSAANDVYATGAGGMLLHFDGTSWRVIGSGKINALWATDASNIWAVGDSGMVLHGDGLGNWTALSGVPGNADLLSVWAPNTSLVYAVGRGGAIYLWNGTAWSAQTSPTTDDLYDVFGIGSTFWACGDNGVLLRDTGTGWEDASTAPDLWVGTNDRITAMWGSGISDLFAATRNGEMFHYQGPASQTVFVPDLSNDSWAVVSCDLDGDTRPDLLFANHGQNTAWLNSGTGQFNQATATRLPTATHDSRSFALGGLYLNGTTWDTKTSVDADSTEDLFEAVSQGQNRLLLNTGSGSFTDATSGTTSGLPEALLSTCVVVGDVNGDGLPDAVIGRHGQQNTLLINTGGEFADGTSGATTGLPSDSDATSGLALTDVDGDGDLDLVVANNGSAQKLLVNDGNGLFQEPSPLLLPADVFAANCVAVADLDFDGHPEILFGVGSGQNRLYAWSGSAYTDASAKIPTDTDDTRHIEIGEFTGDGYPDLIAVNHGSQNRLLVNQLDTTGNFDDGTSGFSTGLPASTSASVWADSADVDHDGDLDVVIVNDGAQDILLLNDGAGLFTDGTDLNQTEPEGLPAATDAGRCALFLDADHDGDLDLVIGNAGEQDRLYLNDGLGEFTDGTDEIGAFTYGLAAGKTFTQALASGDFDGDSDLDLILANYGADSVLLNR